MKITFLGTCSGTEPYPDRRHSSFVIEHNESVFWFDAGESCSYAAYLSGIDLLSTRAIFITHTHMDHIGGLPNLLWTFRKLTTIAGPGDHSPPGNTISVCIPDMDVWIGIMRVLSGTQGSYRIGFHLERIFVQDGVVFEEPGFKVIAFHNQHMGIPADGRPWKSFSYRIETDGQSIAYSGDLRNVNELDSLVENGCDLLLMETGRHQVEDVCRHLRDSSKSFGRLVFTHHGLAVLADPDGELRKARDILGDVVLLADDGMVYDTADDREG